MIAKKKNLSSDALFVKLKLLIGETLEKQLNEFFETNNKMFRQYQEKVTLTKAELKTISSLKITIENVENNIETLIKKSK